MEMLPQIKKIFIVKKYSNTYINIAAQDKCVVCLNVRHGTARRGTARRGAAPPMLLTSRNNICISFFFFSKNAK